jgi:His-Xaa-Ser system radical SAM maturase HxsB
MQVWPIKFRQIGSERYIYANDGGSSFFSDEEFLERYAFDRLTVGDEQFLLENGFAFKQEQDFYHTAALQRIAARQSHADKTSYVILVPTLRCNLACSYCQVSRANEAAKGFDWTSETLSDVLSFLGGLKTPRLKIEFQGGEPLLRLDLLEHVRDFCRDRFADVTFVVCSNLQRLGPRELAFLDHPDVHISTSLDGSLDIHKQNRTRTDDLTHEFAANLREAIKRYGTDKVSALATVDYSAPFDSNRLIETYRQFGFRSFYFRPVHFHGFARKAHAYSRENFESWKKIYLSFIDRLIDLNWKTDECLEEFYFSTCLRRVLRAGVDGHVDLRNPNLYASDYLVIDYDGAFYPTDEARMLTRIGQVDLGIGTVKQGLDRRKLDQLNFLSINSLHEDCIHCPYQPFCGIDLIDDLARYGRVDNPKHATWFCRQQTMIFDRIFEYLASDEEKVRKSLVQWARVKRWPSQGLIPSHDSASDSL